MVPRSTKQHIKLLALLVLLLAPAPSFASKFCAAIAEFANTARPDQDVQLTLGTDWSQMAKYCKHAQGDIEAGKVCALLLPKVVRSFVHDAIEDSIACASDLSTYSLGDGNVVHRADVILQTWQIPGLREGVRVQFRYLIGSHHEMVGQHLNVSAEDLNDPAD